MKIYGSMEELIGNTPLLGIDRFSSSYGVKARIIAKMESFNPAGSAKDRVALEILNAAEKRGEISMGSVIIEPTSGNTGIGLAAIAAERGYRAIMVMPETMSVERRNILKALGAEIVLTPAAEGMNGSIKAAEELKKKIPGSIIAGQFTNPDNPAAHEKTTGPEIWRDTEGKVDILVATAGTGGTITGTGRYLKSMNSEIKVVAVEPAGSAVLSGKPAGAHQIQGIGAGFIPEVLDTTIYDEVIAVEDEDAFEYSKRLAKTEGIFAGISSGAALCAAVELAGREENAGKNIVVILPDGGDRYYSTKLFTE